VFVYLINLFIWFNSSVVGMVRLVQWYVLLVWIISHWLVFSFFPFFNVSFWWMNVYFNEFITTVLLVYFKKLLNKLTCFPWKTILYFNHLNIIKIKIHIIKMNHVNSKKLNNLDNQDRRGKPNKPFQPNKTAQTK